MTMLELNPELLWPPPRRSLLRRVAEQLLRWF